MDLISTHVYGCALRPTHTEPFPFEQLVWLHLVVIYLHAPANWFVGKNIFDA